MIQIRKYLPVWRGVEDTSVGYPMNVYVNFELAALVALLRLKEAA